MSGLDRPATGPRSGSLDAPAAAPGEPVLIGLDWGTTSARAYAFDARGAVLGEQHGPWGIQRIESGNYEGALRRLCAPWAAALGRVPVLACGMIGSRQGWHEADYVACPAPLARVGAALARVDTTAAALELIPGLACRTPDGSPDVLRGEETQIAGLAADGDRVVVLPGTHSKWARVDAGTVREFRTFMTGEVYAVLREHSILGRLARPAELDAAAFLAGVELSRASGAQGGALLHDLFTVRSRALFDELPPTGVEDYLSGILIGSEVVAGIRAYPSAAAGVTLIGEALLCARYARALDHAGVPVALADAGTTARGLWRIAVAAGRVRATQ